MRCTKTTVIWALVALNALLLGGMLFRTNNAATAQVGGRAVPGEYSMVPGDIVGGNGAVIYILDETNRKLTARQFDLNKRAFGDMAPIDLDRVFAAPNPAPGRR